jgi:hypothetical protein
VRALRTQIALATFALAACNDGAIELKLLLPDESASFDMSCVKVVDVLPLGPNDTQPLDIGARTGTGNGTCVTLGRTVTTFGQLQAALANTIDLDIPAGGLAAVEIRGRAGTCADKPAQHEAIFYGGAVDVGNANLSIPLVRSISCSAGAQFTVKPVNMYDLFNTKTCTDYVDSGSQAFSADFRPTLISHQPVTFETGASSQPMSSATAQISSFNPTLNKTCAAIALKDATGTVAGQACINNAGGSTACAGANVELALLPTAYAQASRDTSITKYAGWSFIGVWTTTGTVGPVSGATAMLGSGDDAKIVYGDLGTTAFVPNATATATTASGMIMIYTNALVSVTITAPGKGTTKLNINADAGHPSSSIAVIN